MINDSFDNYMNWFVKLPLKEKQSIAINQLKILSGLAETMCRAKGIKSKMILHQELADLNKNNYTEDDFAEAIVVYINIIQNYSCDYNINSYNH